MLVDKIYKKKNFKEIDSLNSRFVNNINIPSNGYLEYFNIEGGTLRLKKQNTIIDKTIIIPENFVVKIVKNEEIILINESFIISQSSFYVDGGDPKINQPIKIIVIMLFLKT